MAACNDLDAYLDDTLAAPARDAFEGHLLRCPRCQHGIEAVMQLAAAGAELARRADRPRAAELPPRPMAGRARWLPLVAGAFAVAGAALWLVVRPPPAPGARTPTSATATTLDERVAHALAPTRSIAARLPYAPLDRHRPYDVARGADDAGASAVPEPISLQLAAEVEAQRGAAPLAALLIARRDLDQAAALLARAGTSDELEVARASLALSRSQPAAALPHVDGVLARSPAHPLAAWNRAVALDELDLPLAAAEMFARVAHAGEPGWSAEAAARAATLRDREAVRATAWRAGKQACDALDRGTVPDLAVVRESLAICRPAFYEAVRVAPSREAVRALLPIAEALDAAAASTAAVALVRRIAAIPAARRQQAVAVYRELTQTPGLPEAARLELLGRLRAANQDDLMLGALARAGLQNVRAELARLARRTGDPYYLEIAIEREAEELVARGDPLAAELVLKPAVRACAARDVELRCAYLHFALAAVYETLHRPVESRAVARAGILRSRRLGLYWDERQYLDYLAEAAQLARDHAQMRAYLREATLRSAGECAQERYALEALAVASVEERRFGDARRELAAAPTCDEVATVARAGVLAELARGGGTADEAAAALAGLASARRLAVAVGERAQLDAIEGRLLAAREPARAPAMLRQAIARAARAGRGDVVALKARADAYGALLVAAAAAGDDAGTLALFAEATGVELAARCVLGVMVDGERVVVAGRDAAGGIVRHFAPRGVTTPTIDARALVPAAITAALARCPRVDVLALPPVFGLAELLPHELAWAYRGGTARAERGPPRAPTVLAIHDVRPPAELGLAPLGDARLAPIAGATQRELRGAAATPSRVLAAFADADAIEIHAHGFLNRGLSDASLIALSPEGDGRFTLSAREIAGLRLAKAPVVMLAACHAGYVAPYRHEAWGLPRAFLMAGAGAVLASPDSIPDRDAAALFRAVAERILAGVDPAVALRDERTRRTAADPDSWARNVLLFE